MFNQEKENMSQRYEELSADELSHISGGVTRYRHHEKKSWIDDFMKGFKKTFC
ncbi:MAG: bacteriocin [Lentilactobacillus hilgardii]|jgi:bacteriocin-like protein|uniref:Bacteriocin n=1 Tax=Lentilactobacillus hilgardii TaxID=1588 RepID=A0A6P1E2Z1_LENHI|nr:bacteriocin [Lentilactobacillus hilgardii]RRG11852.1 MAG: bacteriocin [Lactobacillus sp.]EEI72138.1 bacteriocin-type signal sequence [Lentilactobacillus hilgardii ATCC 27305]MBZ2200953.1 bacteriocin [Lentilactobacillus hilgardii]MBZ2203866.1 bacteriocin [Lentilactobacillus hilgardii]MCT3392505.1 bacteriocin [Lentilactobacillus hilgardii]